MILNSFDSPYSKFYYDYNEDAIYYYLLIADAIHISIDASWADVVLTDMDTWNEEKIFATFKSVNKDSDDIQVAEEYYKELTLLVKKVRALKQKNKVGLEIIARNKKFINECKRNLKDFRDDIFEYNHVAKLMPYIKNGTWQLFKIDYEQNANEEDGLIHHIVNAFCDRKNTLTLDVRWVEMLSSTTFHSPGNQDYNFIKIPLWDFPPFGDISYGQIKYTRDNLQPGLLQFKLQLSELKDQLSTITFSAENFLPIKQLFNELLFCHIEPVQKLINESLYLSQMRNQFKKSTGYKFFLGIASAETLVNLYEKTETTLPYVASEIKYRIAKQLDLKSACVFIYLENLSPDKKHENTRD